MSRLDEGRRCVAITHDLIAVPIGLGPQPNIFGIGAHPQNNLPKTMVAQKLQRRYRKHQIAQTVGS
jgi:hypothetical protein